MTHSKLQTKRLEAQMSQSQLAAAAGINGQGCSSIMSRVQKT